MYSLARVVGLLCLALVLTWGAAEAGELAYVAGAYRGTAVLGKVVDGKPQAGQSTPVKAELKQKAQRLDGLLVVGADPKDQIVLQINDGKVEDNRLWFQGDELLWKVRFSGEFTKGRIKGQVIFTSQDPTRKLYGQSMIKDYKPTELGGPLDMRRLD